MANHFVIDIHASKLTTHEPSDFDETYINYITTELEQKMLDHGFHNTKITWKITDGSDSG